MRVAYFILIILLFQGLSAQNQFERANINLNFSYADQIEKGDLDGDGLLDLVFGSTKQDRVVWMRNEGNNQFSDYIEFDLDYEQLNGIHVMDFDQDGDLDVITYGARPSNIVGLAYTDGPFVWFKNDGSGGFEKNAIAFDITEFIDLEILDYDSDGDLDLSSFSGVIGPNGSGVFSLALFYANQDGELFTPLANDSTEGVFTPHLFDFADLDNDGDKDLIGGNIEIAVYENYGGTFNLRYEEDDMILRNPIAADVDGDGDLDLVSSGSQLAITRNLGDFNFQTEVLISMECDNLVLSDLDGDGMDDLLLELFDFVQGPQSTNWIKLPFNGTNFSIGLIDEDLDVSDFIAADFDGDGNASFVYAPSWSGVYMRNLEDGSEFEEVLTPFDLSNVVQTADMNLDGLLDIVVYESMTNQFLWLENLGGGQFSSVQALWTPEFIPSSFDLGNVYGSDDIELVYENTITHVVTPLANEVNHFSFPDNGLVSEITLVDLNNNGMHSLLLRNVDDLLIVDILNNQPMVLATIDLDEFAVGDINGDMWMDFAFRDSGKLFVAYGNEEYQFQKEEIAEFHGRVQLGDFNNDGKTDIFASSGNSGQIFIEQLELGQFAEPKLIWDSVSSNIIVEDFDGDTFDEVCVVKTLDLELINWLGESLDPRSTGTSRYTPTPCCTVSTIVDLDVDGDGDLDLITIDGLRESIAVLENMPGLPNADYITIDQCPLTFLNTSTAFYPDTELTWETESGETSESITTFTPDFSEAQSVSLILCNNVGCDTLSVEQTQGIEYVELEIPTQALVDEPIDFSIDSPGATSWSWVFGDGGISLEQSTTYTYEELGTYTIEYFITNANVAGCTIEGSVEIEIVDELAIGDLELSQPFVVGSVLNNEVWKIEYLNNEPFQIELVSLLGKTLLSERARSEMELSIEALPIGTYLLLLKSDDAVFTQKIVKGLR